MKNLVSRQIKILSLGFLFIFLGFNGISYYITPFFSEANMINVGFWSLILTYSFFILFNPLAVVFILRYGAKKAMLLAPLFYSLFIFFLLTKSIFLVYLASSLLGIVAAFLWTGANSFLIMASDDESYGANSGYFTLLQSIGSAFGIVFLSILVDKFLFKIPFLIFSIFPAIGFFLLFELEDLRGKEQRNPFPLIKKSLTSITALKLSTLWFIVFFILGISMGIMPIQIQKTLGLSSVGMLLSLFYIIPIFFSYFFGRLSDIKGRKPMIILSYLLLMAGLFFLYFSEKSIFLISGVFLLALNWTIARPILYALVGDVSNKSNLEFLTSFFWMVQNVGVVSALFVSQIFKTEIQTIYLISIFVTIASLIILLPLFRLKMEEIRKKISQEVS